MDEGAYQTRLQILRSKWVGFNGLAVTMLNLLMEVSRSRHRLCHLRTTRWLGITYLTEASTNSYISMCHDSHHHLILSKFWVSILNGKGQCANMHTLVTHGG